MLPVPLTNGFAVIFNIPVPFANPKMSHRDPVFVVGVGNMTLGDAMLLVEQGTIPPPSTDRSQLTLNTPLPYGFIVVLARVPPAKAVTGKGKHGK